MECVVFEDFIKKKSLFKARNCISLRAQLLSWATVLIYTVIICMCMINETTPPSVIQEIIPEEIGCAGALAALSVSK